MVARAERGASMDRAIHVRLGLNQTRGDERDHQLVALVEMIAARIATAALPSMARSTAGIVSPKSSLVEHAEECNLERTKSLLLGTRSLLSGQKLPCSRFEGVSQDITAAQGFVGLRAILKRVSAEAPPVNSPDSRRNDKHRVSWVAASTQSSGTSDTHSLTGASTVGGVNSRLVFAKTNPISVALANIVALASNMPGPETSQGQDIEGMALGMLTRSGHRASTLVERHASILRYVCMGGKPKRGVRNFGKCLRDQESFLFDVSQTRFIHLLGSCELLVLRNDGNWFSRTMTLGCV
jgi:hypothetical protein